MQTPVQGSLRSLGYGDWSGTRDPDRIGLGRSLIAAHVPLLMRMIQKQGREGKSRLVAAWEWRMR